MIIGGFIMRKWDLYFLRLAREVSKNSKCSSRKVGAVLVRDNLVLSTGYNGSPRNIEHCCDRKLGYFVELDKEYNKVAKKPTAYIDANYNNPVGGCPRKALGYASGHGLHLCNAVHGEINALLTAAYSGVSTKGATLYCYCSIPCFNCLKEIINSGISKIICLSGETYDAYSPLLLKESGIELITYDEEELDE